MARRALVAAIFVLVALYYRWAVRATGNEFNWTEEKNGYYNLLAKGFASGHLHLSTDPSPELLALRDPWDSHENEGLRLHDAVLFNRKYYLYHGAGPAVMLFVPWRILTGYDLPEIFAVALFCFGAFAFYAAALLRVCKQVPWYVLAAMLLAVGVCNSAPFLTNRIWVYEVPIAGGMFCLAGAFYFLVRGFTAASLAAAGLFFGLAIACRPHLGLAGALCVVVLGWTALKRRVPWRNLLIFGSLFAVCGLTVAWYNYARFGDPLEFGVRYLLAGGREQQRIKLSSAHLLPSLYYFLACPPFWTPVFPFFNLAARLPFNAMDYPLPRGYFIEPTVGIVWLSPFVLASLLPGPKDDRLRLIVNTGLASSVAILLFVSLTGFTSQRYEVDFLPLLVFVAVVKLASFRQMNWVLVPLVAYSVFTNLAIAITGPYDEVLYHKPARYVRIARWFTPSTYHLPILKPTISIKLELDVAEVPVGSHEPVLVIGSHAYYYELVLEHKENGLALMSDTSDQLVIDQSAPLPSTPRLLQFTYDPERKRIEVRADDRLVLEHEGVTLIAAPSQIYIGENGKPGFRHEQARSGVRAVEKSIR